MYIIVYVCADVCVCIYIYIYIYRERERLGKGNEKGSLSSRHPCPVSGYLA